MSDAFTWALAEALRRAKLLTALDRDRYAAGFIAGWRAREDAADAETLTREYVADLERRYPTPSSEARTEQLPTVEREEDER